MKFFCGLAAIFALCVPVASVSQTSRRALSLSISLPQQVLKSGLSVEVDITRKNLSKHPVGVAQVVGTVERDYEVIVRNSDGRQVPETEFWRKIHGPDKDRDRFESVVLGTLKPGQELHQQLYANAIYDLRSPGTYSIQVAQIDSASNLVIRSNTVTLTVTP
jgi:hypothetical protein